jgi:MYXO-CTERM domain-containing protein
MTRSRPLALAGLLALLAASSVPAFAQDNTQQPAPAPTATEADNDADDGFDMGWLGLLGLAGLAGLRRNRHDADVRTTMNR